MFLDSWDKIKVASPVWDVFKLLNSPDDPAKRGLSSPYNFWINSNGYEVPEIMLGSDHSYFSRLMRGNWFSIGRVIDPEVLNGPKSKYFSEDSSEYHPGNITNYPEHKKMMQKWVSISSKFHKNFENNNQIYNMGKESKTIISNYSWELYAKNVCLEYQ